MTSTKKIIVLVSVVLALFAFGCEEQAAPSADGQPPAASSASQASQAPAAQPPNSDPGNFAGNTRVAAVPNSEVITIPRILWGAEMAALYANGGKDTTQANSIYAEQGLNIKFTPGDDFPEQVANYKAGKTPFLRGTLRMVSLASEELGKDERTRPVVIMQLTWSAGDHMVCRKDVKTVSDLRGKKVVLQKSGPHMGMLDDALRTATLTWEDLTVTYVNGITGANGPAVAFKNDASIACAFVVTPDAIGLMGDLDTIGTGAEGTVEGAHMGVSTRELNRSIADVYAVRSDWYQDNKSTVTKFVAATLKGIEETLQLKRDYETNGPNKRTYVAKVLKPAQAIFGSTVLPNDDEAHGLLSDAQFVGHQGNVVFFNEANNPVGFAAMNERGLDLAVNRGFATKRIPLLPSTIEWHSDAFMSYLSKTGQGSNERFDANKARSEVESMTKEGTVDSHTIYSFTVKFDPGQTTFDSAQYKNEFTRGGELSRMYGGAINAIRGHADPTMTLRTTVQAGCQNGTLVCNFETKQYTYNGNQLNLLDTRKITELIETGAFDKGVRVGPRQVMQQATNLSLQRAKAVRESLIEFLKAEGIKIDETQIQAQGVGVLEPIVPKPKNPAEAAQNQRVEFRIIRVSAEATKAADFDF